MTKTNLLMKFLSNLQKRNMQELTLEAFIKHVPLKKKYLRANYSKFVTKELNKAIMLRSKLRKIFLKDITDESRSKY